MESKLFLLLTPDFSSLDAITQEEVYRDFYKLVHAAAFYILKDHAAAEDIVQEAFIKTIYHAPPMDNERQLRAWIKVVTKNLSLNILRKNKHLFHNKLDIEDTLMVKETSCDSVEGKVEINLLEQSIMQSLSEMTPDHRDIIKMKWKDQFSIRDIAKQKDSTEGAIKQKLFRAREALRRKLRQKWRDHDE